MVFVNLVIRNVGTLREEVRELAAGIIKTNESIKVVSDTVTLTDKASEDRLKIHKLQLKERELRSLLSDSDKVL